MTAYFRPASGMRRLPARYAALAGVAAAAAGLGLAELLAGIVAGAASPIVAVGEVVIALQPPGAKQLVVDLFGEADKVVLGISVVVVALAAGAGLGLVHRASAGLARGGYAAFGLLAWLASLRDGFTAPLLSALVLAAGAVLAAYVLDRLAGRPAAGIAEMPDWGRRRVLGGSLAVIGAAAVGGGIGRVLLESRGATPVSGGVELPSPARPAAPLPADANLAVDGITPIVTPNEAFYRIDTALLVPRPNPSTWRLRVHGMVDAPFELTYDDLLAMPLEEHYVTIACVSNEVGGDLVGNARWTGVLLRELLEHAGVQDGATQAVGRSVDGWTAGFPTAWAMVPERPSLVAVGMNGEVLPPDHGFPARLIVPGLYGYVSATKWISEIELTTLEAFDAYWVPLGWAKKAPILTQSRIDSPRRGATLRSGTVPVAGVAWAPDRGVSAVEMQVDDGPWLGAELSTPISDATWVQWLVRWEATPGRHQLRVRATDGNGMVQTATVTRPAPDGARGHHEVEVTVE